MPNLLERVKNSIVLQIIGFGVGAAAATAFEPAFRPLAHRMEAQFTNMTLTPAELAALVQRGVRSEDDAAEEAKTSGINRERFRELSLLAGDPPAPVDLLQLWRRGAVTESEVDHGFIQGRVRTEWLDNYKKLKRERLPFGEAASLAARGYMDDNDAQETGEWHGLDSDDIDAAIKGVLRPPALGELLDLLNRGEVNEALVRTAMIRGAIAPEYHEALLELRYHLAPPTDTIRFAVREAYSPDAVSRFGMDQDFPQEFLRDAAKVGITPELAQLYWRAHWDLPSPQMGFGMLHRGIISNADLELLLRALDVMPFWRDKLIQLAYLVPGRIDLRRMFAAGVIDEARVYRGYLDIGYAPEDARLLTDFATQESLADEKTLAKSEITALYQSRTMTAEDAKSLLNDLGYNDASADLILALADVRREKTFRNAQIAATKRRYLDREITVTEASTRLDNMGIQPDERDDLLDLWEFELSENPRRLTQAQARSVFRRGFKDEAWYRGYLALLGFPDEEIDLLVQLDLATE